jgi:transcriptional regulator with XRE-family HTH domain
MSTIGTRIRDLRISKGMTQTALCGDGISSGYVSLIESGKRTPSDRMVREIADRLGVSVEEILRSDETPRVDPRLSDHARLDVNFAKMALANGNPAEAARIVSRLELDTLDNTTANDAASVLSQSLEQAGDMVGAVRVLRTLVERNRQEQAWSALARAATTLTTMLIESGDINAAVDVGRDCMAEIEKAGLAGSDEHLRLGAIYMFALFGRGDTLSATEVVESLIKVADRVGTSRARGSVYWNAAIVAHRRGAVDEALRLTDRAVALLGEEEDSRDLPRLRMNYAWLLLHQENPDAIRALAELERAERALRDSKLEMGVIHTSRGRAFLCLGQHDDAAENAASALQMLGPSEHIDRTEALILLGDVGAARFEEDLACESYREAHKVLSSMDPSREVARLWRQLGDSLRRYGDQPGALTAYDAALAMTGFARTPQTSRVRLAAA